ncbi:MAG: chloride channel protein [Roseateles depolymerans]|uniref:Chloride channel protein n=1 Tax=Roseateles depolymerans TaxID=76731 RepID=A0A2W5FET1_9BURK|nr:MAG: chloride channel protein [Roseateles depolymerans]
MKARYWWFRLQRELADWRLWLTRALVIAFAALAGLSIVAFSWLGDWALERFFELRGRWAWAPLIWTPLCTLAIVALTRRYWPGAGGSGIPQVMAALDPAVPAEQRGLYVSLRLSLAKVLLTSWGLLGGLSLGREGPSVQVAAGVMHAARRWLPERTAVSAHGLLVAGGAAGIAAAFNTPLGGVMFAIEELSGRPEQRSSGLLIAGIVLAGLVGASINGNGTYFGVIRVQALGWSLLWPGLLLAVGCGLFGGLFSRLMINGLRGDGRDLWSRWRRARPLSFALGCGFAVALIGFVSGGATFGSGYGYTQALLHGGSLVDGLYAPLKLLATWLTAWSGVPAGIFAPSLAIGAAWGADVAALLGQPQAPALIALGMVGFLAATTQAPLTAFIIVMEMVDGHAMVLSLMACALIASGVSRLISPPLYRALTQLQLARLPARASAQAAQAPSSSTSASSS